MTAPGRSARRVTYTDMPMTAWLELFYDLIFVAAILVFSSAVSHLHDGVRIAWVVGVFVALWWIWVSTTMFINRFRVDDLPQRLLVLVQMFLVVVLAVEALEGTTRDSFSLSLTFAAIIGTVAVMYWRATRIPGSSLREFATSRARWSAATTVIFVVAAPFDDPVRVVLWVLGLLASLVPAVVQSERLGPTAAVDEPHVVERMGAFTIIVCGEAFVKVAIAISNADVIRLDLTALAFQFVLTFAIWSSYFEDIPDAGIGSNRFFGWTSLHLMVQIGIAATAIGVAQLVAVGPLDEVPDAAILEIMGALIVIYVGLALLGTCTRRRPIRPLVALRLGTAAVVAVVGVLAWRIPDVDVVEGLGALSVVAVLHGYLATRLRRHTTVAPAADLR